MTTMYKIFTSGKGKKTRYAIKVSSDGGKTWKDTGFSYGSPGEANLRLEELTERQRENEEYIKNAHLNSKTGLEDIFKSKEEDVMTKAEAEKAGIPWKSLPTDYDLRHPDLNVLPSMKYIGWIDDDGMVHVPKGLKQGREQPKVEKYIDSNGKVVVGVPPTEPIKKPKKVPEGEIIGNAIIPPEEKPAEAPNTEVPKTDTPNTNVTPNEEEKPAEAPNTEVPNTDTLNTNVTPETTEVPNTDTLNTNVTLNEEEKAIKKAQKKAEREARKAARKEANKKYWNNILYGNDIGSAQKSRDAKEDKDLKMNNFLKDNPNMVRAVFGKNSGLNFGERVSRLGEMLAMMGADATKGAYAGFNKMSLPEPTKGKYTEIYKNALNKQYARKQDVFDSGNKAVVDKENRVSILKSSPILNVLPDYILGQLADKMVVGISKEERDNFNNWLNKRYSNEYIEEIWNTYNTLRSTFSDITAQRGNVIELNGKEFDLTRKPQTAIAELNSQKAQLQKMLVEVDSMPYDKLSTFMSNFKSIYSGIQSVSNSMSENKDFGYKASVEVKGGIPAFGGSGSGGIDGKKGSEKSTDTKIDSMALEGLALGKTTAEEWNSKTKASRNALKASIQAAIDEIDNQIKVLKKYHAIDDGIVKAPHMKQWLVREDGTRIALNPNDNIYATKNELTTPKDNSKEDIVPMEKEDRVKVIQKKLGYNGDRNIIKQCDYYISKLK